MQDDPVEVLPAIPAQPGLGKNFSIDSLIEKGEAAMKISADVIQNFLFGKKLKLWQERSPFSPHGELNISLIDSSG